MTISRRMIRDIESTAKGYFKGASGCHDFTHVERVRALALKIGKKEKANLEVVEIAALLHDIGRKQEMQLKGTVCHAEIGAKLAKKILQNLKYSGEKQKNIIHCILTHRTRNKHKPETVEAKVLHDADKLDSIGAVGVARDFLFVGNAGSKTLYTGNEKRLAKSKKDYSFTNEDSAILEYEIKLKYIYKKILTQEGKKIAKERHRYMKEFFQRFWDEVNGIR